MSFLYPFSALTLMIERQEGRLACKKSHFTNPQKFFGDLWGLA